MKKRAPVVSLIGRPNVGKSTLFNRIMRKGQKALSFDMPGVTRDRHYAIAEIGEWDPTEPEDIILIDTGGFYPDRKGLDESNPHEHHAFFDLMVDHGKAAIEESDLVLFVVDVREGLLPFDNRIADYIRTTDKPFWLIVNKFDTEKQRGEEGSFWELGIEESQFYLTSAEHAVGMRTLREDLQKFAKNFSKEGENLYRGVKPNYDVVSSLAIVGVPNVGKSTLLNQFVGQERALVSDIAGTTVDPIEGYIDLYFGDDVEKLKVQENQFRLSDQKILELEDEESLEKFIQERESLEIDEKDEEIEASELIPWRSIKIVDTAGIRKSKSVEGFVESQAVYASLRAMSEADIVLFLVDAQKGVTHQDRKLMGIALEKGKSLIIAINKIDLLPEVVQDSRARKEWLEDLKYKIPWLSFCELIPISAKTGSHLKRLKRSIMSTILIRHQKIPTGELNRYVNYLVDKNPLYPEGARQGKLFKVKYTSLLKSDPPTFLFFSNLSKGIPEHFKRYLKNGLREEFRLKNTPVHLIFRTSGELKKRNRERN